MKRPHNILVTRFSAMGDVAMLAAVVRRAAAQNPHVRLHVVTRKGFEPFFLFGGAPSNMEVAGVDLKDKRYSSLSGVVRLAAECRKRYCPDAVADMHSSLRSRIIRLYMRLCGIGAAVIDKQRRGRRMLTRRHNKTMRPLRPMTECYADVLRSLGLTVTLTESIRRQGHLSPFFNDHSSGAPAVGVAPFARHEGKIYPVELMEQVIKRLSDCGCDIFVFGGGDKEKAVASRWAGSYNRVVSVIGRLDMEGEMALMSNLDAMVSMDSASQHIASLVGLPVVSVWGATHPYAGFGGYGQEADDMIGDSVGCRPCSIFGNRTCYKGTRECMRNIDPMVIADKVLARLGLS